MRNRLSVSVVVAIAAVLLPLVVVAPAHGSGGRMAAAPDGVWVPPDDADDARIPDSNVPDEAWAPPAEVRLQQPPDANERGIAPFGAPVGTVVAAPGIGELPWFAFEDFPLSSDATAGVNIANSNLLGLGHAFVWGLAVGAAAGNLPGALVALGVGAFWFAISEWGCSA